MQEVSYSEPLFWRFREEITCGIKVNVTGWSPLWDVSMSESLEALEAQMINETEYNIWIYGPSLH